MPVRPLTNALAPPDTPDLIRNRKVAAPWGSRSQSRVRCPSRAARYARLTAAEVLPTPPLMLYVAKTFTMRARTERRDAPVAEGRQSARTAARTCRVRRSGARRVGRRADPSP